MRESSIKSISPADLRRLIDDDPDIELIDVRPREMFEAVRIEQAVFVEFGSLDPDGLMASRRRSGGEPLYVICQVGIRSVKACEQFVAAGHENVVNIEGGTRAWSKARLPVVGSKKEGAGDGMWTRFKKRLFGKG